VYQKSGSTVIPKPSLGVPVFENVPIEWYSEVFIREGKYVLRYELQNASGTAVAGTQGFKRLQNGVNPIRISYGMDAQNSGAYAIKTEILDATGTVLKEATTSLMWYNDDMLIDPSLLEGVLTRASFEKSWGNWEEVPEYLSMIAPLASLAERRLLMNLKESMDTARAAFYLTRFWQEKAPDQALESWMGYKRVVDQVDSEFGSKTLAGYKTQMGRVFLQYGAPSLVEERPFDGKNYPYQIWQYDRLVSSSTPTQQNQVFIFVDQELVGRQYTLIHSSALGEVKDHKWQFHLSRHSNTGPDIDATSTQYSRDNFGERISNSLIIGNQGTWFDQFNN
jgi:GWxTD domain-containing protein